MSNPGHVSRTRGDLTRLACDASLLPSNVDAWYGLPYTESNRLWDLQLVLARGGLAVRVTLTPAAGGQCLIPQIRQGSAVPEPKPYCEWARAPLATGVRATLPGPRAHRLP